MTLIKLMLMFVSLSTPPTFDPKDAILSHSGRFMTMAECEAVRDSAENKATIAEVTKMVEAQFGPVDVKNVCVVDEKSAGKLG